MRCDRSARGPLIEDQLSNADRAVPLNEPERALLDRADAGRQKRHFRGHAVRRYRRDRGHVQRKAQAYVPESHSAGDDDAQAFSAACRTY